MESSGGSDKFSGGDGFRPRVLPEPGETLTDRVNREKQRRLQQMGQLFAQRDKRVSASNQRYIDEITRMPNPARKAAAEAKRARKNAKRLADLEASR